MRKVISIFLSLLLLVSSTGITYAKHYCGDFEMLAEVTFGEKELSCGMVMESSTCDDEEEESHNCCDNEYTQIETDENFAKASFDIDLQQTFVASFVSIFVLHEVLATDEEQEILTEYHPPPLLKDITVLYETFLI